MTQTQPVVVITGAAKRIGKAIALLFHQQQYHVVIHYNRAETDAFALVHSLNQQRANSASLIGGDLSLPDTYQQLADFVSNKLGRLDVLVNNASNFYPTTVGQCDLNNFHDLMAINAQAPLLLSQQLVPLLNQSQGSIVNLIDIHATKPYRNHAVYCMAKAALASLTKSLALELAPNIRVNGIAPGAILWPQTMTPEQQQQRVKEIPLQQLGAPNDIANAVMFLTTANYITGQILAVDGGASLV
ncbi:pteridine reductase [Neiella marina]|uniref:Pteridine reductase n=1 Tax=Neiella marina TaxID=508461 RepID=A0A8J2U3E2_9GAMM|nr:pteridine reductase [Neiella marina]GGA70432.1 pteridine reductase [Neiella marina]